MDPIRIGMLKAAAEDYERHCRILDERAERETREALSKAYYALMRGDTAERDRICAAAQRLPDAIAKAKLEIGLRIGERIGLDRDEVIASFERHMGRH